MTDKHRVYQEIQELQDGLLTNVQVYIHVAVGFC